MKTLLQILFFSLLLSATAFPQHGIYSEEIMESADIKYQRENLKLNAYVLKEFNVEDSRVTLNKSQPENSFLTVEMIHQVWDTTQIINFRKYTYTYDMNDNLFETLVKEWNGTGWEKDWKVTYTYDVNNNVFRYIMEMWDGNNWVNSRRMTFTYDVNNNPTRKLDEIWNNNNWENYKRLTYTYDENNNMIGMLQETWSTPNWVKEFLETNYYNGNNYRIERLWKTWNGSEWVNSLKYYFYYDTNDNLVQELHLGWINSNWENREKYTFIYDLNNNLFEQLQQYWLDPDWINHYKFNYTYNISNNNLIETLVRRWEPGWKNYERYTHFYLPAGSEQVEHKRENLNKPIEDFQTTEDDLIITSLSKTQNLSLIGVQILIDSVLHSSDSDLEFTLTHNGISETIIYRAGGSGDNFIGTKLTDDGIDSISGGIAPFSGNYKPENSLYPFAGTDPAGTWTLSIYDGAAGNTGTLQAWGLMLIYNSSVSVENETTFNPEQFQLYQNYPNPFNPSTIIRFKIPQDVRRETRDVTLKVYDVLGKEVATLVKEELLSGEYEVEFNPNRHSRGGRNPTSGVYFYQLRAGSPESSSGQGFIQTKKMLLIK